MNDTISMTTIPCPTTLQQLRDRYDELIQYLNEENAADASTSALSMAVSASQLYHQCQTLRTVCSILLAILSKKSVTSLTTRTTTGTISGEDTTNTLCKTLHRTARRCCLLQSYLRNASTNDYEDGLTHDEYMAEFPVIVEQNLDSLWSWKIVDSLGDCANDDGDDDDHDFSSNIISISKEELAAEEATLLLMANTPIPSEKSAKTPLPTNLEDRAVKRQRLQEQVQQEWGF